MKATMSQYLKGIPARFRTPIRKAAIRKGLTPTVERLKSPDPLTGASEKTRYRMNPENREVLASAIFEIENEFESQGIGRPHHRAVVAMRAARNELYDDLGWNETGSGWSERPDVTTASMPAVNLIPKVTRPAKPGQGVTR